MNAFTRSVRSLLAPVALTVVALSSIGALLTSSATPAAAHTGDQTYLYLDVTDTTLSGRIEAPARDLRGGLGLSLEGDDEVVIAELEANQERLHDYFDDHFDIGDAALDWRISFEGLELFYSDLPEIDDNYVLFPFTVEVDGGEVPRVFEVRFDPFFDEIEGRDALLLIGNDWKGGVIDNGATVYSAYNGGNRTQTVDLGETGWLKNVVASAKLGVNHIRTGPDHILFVLVLLLPSVLVFTSRWEPAPSFTAALWRVLKIVTMFTVAHSITFTLAGLEILPLPSSRIVESIIAISIAAAALHNIRPIAANKEWLISFAFGLFHGMGFASLVSGLDVDRGTQLVSLLGRNIGIEIGQTVVVFGLFPALFLLRRTRWYQPFFVAVSVLLAIVSVGWMIERVFDVDLAVSSFVEPIVAWPQVILYVAALTAIAYALHRRETSADRLVPVAGTDSVSDDGTTRRNPASVS